MAMDPRDLVKRFVRKNPQVPQLKFVMEDETFSVTTAGKYGNLNNIYRVESSNKEQSIIIKYSEEDLKFSEGTKIPLERQTMEYNCLKTLHELVPGCVPQPYCYDANMHIIAMEDLDGFELLGEQLVEGEFNPETAAQIGRLQAELLLVTHRSKVSSQTWEDYIEKLRNTEVRSLCNFYRIDATCDHTHPIVHIPQENLEFFTHCVAVLKERNLLEKLHSVSVREECFSHADLHGYSLLLKEARIAMIDFEFGSMGHSGFSVAYLSAFYFMFMKTAQEKKRENGEELQKQAQKCILSLVNSFIAALGEDVSCLGPIGIFYSELALLIGHVLFMFPAFVHIDNLAKLTYAQRRDVMETGYRLLTSHQELTTLVSIMKTIYP